MSKTDHLARAKDYIAKGEDYYRKAAEEIVAAMEENPALGQREVARSIGKGQTWVGDLVRWYTSGRHADQPSPFAGSEYAEKKEGQAVRRALRDPDQRRQVIESLKPDEVDKLARDATDVAVERSRAQRKEHQTEPTVRDLTKGERFDPAEHWADRLVIRLHNNALELAALRKRAGGLIYGSMSREEAFDYLMEAEQLIADARAEAQEQARDVEKV